MWKRLYEKSVKICKICESIKKHAKNIIDFEKKKVLPLTKKELKSRQDGTVCYSCRKTFIEKFAKDKNHRKVRGHFHYTVKYKRTAHSLSNLRFNVPNGNSVVFHNGSNCDYQFTIKEIANEFEGQFECVGENREKYKALSVPIEKELLKVDKEGNKNIITLSYKIEIIDSARYMATSLSSLVDNIIEGINKIKVKDCDCFIEYEIVKHNLITYKCPSCNRDYLSKVDEELTK